MNVFTVNTLEMDGARLVTLLRVLH